MAPGASEIAGGEHRQGASEAIGSAEAAALPWQRSYVFRLRVSDLLVIIWAVFAAQFVRFPFSSDLVGLGEDIPGVAVDYTMISIVLVVAWYAALSGVQAREPRILGTNSDEYRRVVEASMWVFGLFAIVSYLLKFDLARGYFLTSIPLGVFGLLLSRWMWRKWLRIERRAGRMADRVVVVGSRPSVAAIVQQLIASPEAGYVVAGACVDDGVVGTFLEDTAIPVLGGVSSAIDSLDVVHADTLVVTSSRLLPPRKLRELSWALEPGLRHLVMAPALVDVAGPRIVTRPVAGLPLVHVESPRYTGGASVMKRGSDLVLGAIIAALLSPLMLVVAVLVKATSEGPVFFRQQRVGKDGEQFAMLKFRSMVVDADKQLKQLLDEQGTADTPLFKIKNDPRLTRIGAVLRRYSLDELPQIFNVLRGDMSLVGPRPQVPAEVALYDHAAARRLNVRPGMTGLWQVSGRSALSWEEAIRLDLYYVENWSLVGDFVILWRTGRAVFARDGSAY